MDVHFNLITKPWIPVVSPEGKSTSVGIREALVNAHYLRQLGCALPHANAAIYRLLLAILHRVFGPADETEWQALWERGSFDALQLDTYLTRWQERFDLFSPTHPFYQNRHPKVEIKPANALLDAVAGGDSDTLFDHTFDAQPITLPADMAALILLAAQNFGLAGLCHPQHKLFYADGTCSRAVVFLLQGKNLFESLMLNLVRYNRRQPIEWAPRKTDLPAWEMDDPYEDERTIPNGYLDYLTWHSRKIWLFPSHENGMPVVREITIAPGLVMNAEQLNPMHHYTLDEDNGRKPIRFQEGRALWRDSSAIFDLKSNRSINPQALHWTQELISNGILPHRRLQLAAYGMSTEPGKHKVHFYRGEEFEFSDDLLNDSETVTALAEALDTAESLRRQLWGALSNLASLLLSTESDLEEGRKANPDDVKRMIYHWGAEGFYWKELELPFFRLLDSLSDNNHQAKEDWTQSLRRAGYMAFTHAAKQCGNDTKGLKAVAKATLQLRHGMKLVLEPEQKEE